MAYINSPEKVIDWLKRDEGSERYYAKQFARVFGRELDVAWDEWIAWEKEFQAANLARINQEELTPTKHLANRRLAGYQDPICHRMGLKCLVRFATLAPLLTWAGFHW